jgi:hypothetical protein
MTMNRVFVLIAVICFLLAFIGTGFNLNGGHPYGHMSWNDLIALGLFFFAAAGFV